MRRAVFLLAVLLACLLAGMALPHAQAQSSSIVILDKNRTTITKLTDGDSIQLSVRLANKASQPTRVAFALEPDKIQVAECTVQTNSDTCDTPRLAALGWYWSGNGQPQRERTISAAANGTLATTMVQIAPRPVVMAHGFISSADAWATYLGPNGYLAEAGLQGFAVGDGQFEGKLNTGSLTNPTGKTNTIVQNAEILSRYVASVKQATGAQQVDLVVHSMGGMISRYYIDRLMQERDVAQLIMLGTPHNGTDCANLPASLNLYIPASLEIRPSYMRGVFNSQITHRRGVQFYELAGTSIIEAFKSPCSDVPTDIAVSLASAQGIPLNLKTISLLHTDLNVSKQVFESFVKPLLQKPASEFRAEPDAAPASNPPEDLQFTRILTGHVDAGGSQEVTVNIDQVAVASFALYDPTRSLTVTVRGASGNVIALDAARNGLIIVDDPSTLVYLGYGFQNPRPGPWRITLQATGKTPAGGADYALTAQLRGGATIKASTSTLLPRLNQAVDLTARLELAGQPLTVQEARALVRNPDGRAETVPLTASGNDWKATWKPTTTGVHGINIQLSGTAPDGTLVEREASLAVQVQPSAGQVAASQRLLSIVLGAAGILGITLIAWLLARKRRRTVRG
jgi:pimeloyl-ACP methyl ester carboxylesterase